MNKVIDLQSRTISYLRFPLTAIVVFSHCNLLQDSSDNPIYEYIDMSFDLLSKAAVILFFFFSGYLFFIKLDKFSVENYYLKLKSRFKSLFIPYLFWNFIVVLLYLLVSVIYPSILPGESIENYNISDWIKSFYDASCFRPDSTSPLNRPLWYIRDLIIVVICSPAIYFLVKYLRLLCVIILGILWLVDVPSPVGFSFESFFFFSFGAYFGIFKRSFLPRISLGHFLIFFAIIYFVLLVQINKDSPFIIGKAMVIYGGIICLFAAAWYAGRKIEVRNSKISQSSFFIYCYHGVVMTAVKTIILAVFVPVSDIAYVCVRFVTFFVVFGSGILAYILLCKRFPSFIRIITGGRTALK